MRTFRKREVTMLPRTLPHTSADSLSMPPPSKREVAPSETCRVDLIRPTISPSIVTFVSATMSPVNLIVQDTGSYCLNNFIMD